MTNEYITNRIEWAIEMSKGGAITWLMSNGEKLEVTSYENWKKSLEKHGYWVAKIFRYGHECDL